MSGLVARPSLRILEVLSKSPVYRDYESAFTQATGLPLRLQGVNPLNVVRYSRKQETPFSALMAKIDRGCAQSNAQRYALQCRLEEQAQLGPKTLTSFAGICETAVPLRLGINVIAFLHTGQVLLKRPDQAQFDIITAELIKWGAVVDLKKLQECYFNTRVITLKQYDALIRLLSAFAGHLTSCSGALLLEGQREDSPAIAQARSFISEHADEELSLAAVANVVNMSATYFSEKFKEVTGLNFVNYVSRTRVENAQHLFHNPKLRISEVAFEVGFQSLSQFNRAFRTIAGDSPREYRAKLATVGI